MDGLEALSTGFNYSLDILAWTTWHLTDTLRIALAIYIWLLFYRLNRGIVIQNLGSKNFLAIMGLHLKVNNLLRLINNILGPITFMGCIFSVLYSCFYFNFILAGFASITRLFLFTHFLLKNLTIYLVSADINSKAHAISEWLELLCAKEECLEIPPEKADKLIIFTAHVYSKDTVGFKGLNFFIISTSFLTAIASLIATYTVVITQFSGYEFVARDNSNGGG
ncbi:unnamed protein product [Allacma fusca]|uniref:Uncharacterized protein n=1 Tax=Allacma fusca TaxID=39272 RepID=A0A8J2P2U2_9HEXA|nr:unnamed protein product [Allacma fusca]